jgi:hypothetical protein
MMALKSISLASLRKSSFGFPRNMYTWPLLPRMVILRGLAKERIISMSSKNSAKEDKYNKLKYNRSNKTDPQMLGHSAGKADVEIQKKT